MPLIGICGRRNSGKDTAAQCFVREHNFVSMSIADPIKKILQEYFWVPAENLWGPSSAKDPRTREMLQQLGTDFAHRFDSDVWIRHLKHRIQTWHKYKIDILCRTCRPYTDKIVVPDIRYPSEAHMITNQGTLLKIVRPGIDYQTPQDQHRSETSVNNIPEKYITKTIVNNGSLSDLRKEVATFVHEVTNVPHPQ